MVILVIIVVGALILGVGYWLGLRTIFRCPTEHERASSALRQAMDAVDDVFYETRIRMEEAVGRRQPGERRFGDDLRGSWRDW
jgi:hypothetical protein